MSEKHRKCPAADPTPIAITADGKPFDHSAVYYFFDALSREIRESSHLRRIDAEHLGSTGLRVVPISRLRTKRDDACSDAQAALLAEIDDRRRRISELEQEKRPEARSLKAILMSRE